jgi:nitrate/nitrite transporter NarK
MLPIGVLAFAVSFSGPLARRVHPKYLVLAGQALVLAATVLLAFASAPGTYWRFAFPGFCLGTAGAMLAYTHANIALFANTPAAEAGTAGALFNGALQLGSAVGLAAVTSVEASVEARTPEGAAGFQGRRAALWFLLAVVALEAVAVAVFYRVRAVPHDPAAEEHETASPAPDTSEKTTDAVARPEVV